MEINPFPAIDEFSVQLALETTGRSASLAVLQGQTILRETVLDRQRRTASGLAVILQSTLAFCRGQASLPSFVSVAAGPGSFTGLRIGVTTAKTLSYALRIPLVAVDSLACIAATAFFEQPRLDAILVGINAYRGQVYAGRFTRAGTLMPIGPTQMRVDTKAESGRDRQPPSPDLSRPDGLPAAEHAAVCTAGEWLGWLSAWPATAAVTGDATLFPESGRDRWVDVTRADAVGVGLLGLRAAIAGRWADPIGLAPNYLKPSAAEEQTPLPPAAASG